jgi:hypothetical protein
MKPLRRGRDVKRGRLLMVERTVRTERRTRLFHLNVGADQIDDIRRFEDFLYAFFRNLGHGSCLRVRLPTA